MNKKRSFIIDVEEFSDHYLVKTSELNFMYATVDTGRTRMDSGIVDKGGGSIRETLRFEYIIDAVSANIVRAILKGKKN